MSIARPSSAITVARVDAIEIAFNWRWLPILFLGTALLATSVLSARYPAWDTSTIWMTSAAAVLAGEAALLLHELSHAFVARGRGHEVRRIVFHGFAAETFVHDTAPTPLHETLIALVGPATNVGLAAGAALIRWSLSTGGALDVFLVLLVLGNLATAAMSLVPLGSSDGRRVLTALRARKRAGQAPRPTA